MTYDAYEFWLLLLDKRYVVLTVLEIIYFELSTLETLYKFL